MTLKRSIIIDDRKCICKKCSKANTCDFYIKYAKFLDLLENIEPNEFIIKMTVHVRKCNLFIEDKK